MPGTDSPFGWSASRPQIRSGAQPPSWILLAAVLLQANQLGAEAGAIPYPRVTLEVVGQPSELGSGRWDYVRIRVVNADREPIPGVSFEAYQRGEPVVALGAWFADERPRQIGTFQFSTWLDEPLPPGQAAEFLLKVRPPKPGQQFLCFGLYRASRDATLNGPVGRMISLPVGVVSGGMFADHKGPILLGILIFHYVGMAGALWLLIPGTRR